jgi:hypothetical protein
VSKSPDIEWQVCEDESEWQAVQREPQVLPASETPPRRWPIGRTRTLCAILELCIALVLVILIGSVVWSEQRAESEPTMAVTGTVVMGTIEVIVSDDGASAQTSAMDSAGSWYEARFDSTVTNRELGYDPIAVEMARQPSKSLTSRGCPDEF